MSDSLHEISLNIESPRVSRQVSMDIESPVVSDQVSMDIQSQVSIHQHRDSKGVCRSIIFQLAFQSMGIVYGDLGTSPLYVLSSTFPDGVKHADDILGVISLIFYTITLMVLVNYIFIILRSTDNGNGGTFALYSLICRHANVRLIPSDQQAEDFELPSDSRSARRASKLKSMLESSHFAKLFLLCVTLLATSMVIGDGILTPSISVLSAVRGIKQATSALTEDKIVCISVAILVCLFTFQRVGTAIVGYSFAPIMSIWFILISAIGLYNIIQFNPTVIKAVNPLYIIEYFRRNNKGFWISLGGIVLSITGCEALFAAVGHFTVQSVQICTCIVVYPAILLAYFGQASVLRHHPEYVKDAFYKSIPGPLYWPMFVVAVLAAIIASQALISGAFTVIQQSLASGCFPRVKVVHTSAEHEGQVYIPEINFLLMLACVGVTFGFKTAENMASAYGIALIFVMILTSFLLVIVMILVWKSNLFYIISYVLIIGSVEIIYLSSVMSKFDQGGYLPLVFSALLMTLMFVWNHIYRRKYNYELENSVSSQRLKEIAADTSLCRIPGVAMFYSELVDGIPPVFEHYVANVSALHSVLVFVSMKSLPISMVPLEERFIFCRVEPKELSIFLCVARFGYTDVHKEETWESVFVDRLKSFIREDYTSQMKITGGEHSEVDNEMVDGEIEEENIAEESMERDIEIVEKAWRAGVVHFIGESEVVAAEGAGIGTRVMINYVYDFLKRNFRQDHEVFNHIFIPSKSRLKVGIIYEL